MPDDILTLPAAEWRAMMETNTALRHDLARMVARVDELGNAHNALEDTVRDLTAERDAIQRTADLLHQDVRRVMAERDALRARIDAALACVPRELTYDFHENWAPRGICLSCRDQWPCVIERMRVALEDTP